MGIGVSAAKKRGLSARRRLQELLPMAVDAFSAARPSRTTRLRDSIGLFLAIRRRDHDLVGALLERHPELVAATEAWSREEAMELGLQNAEGGTPLVRAVQTGDLRLVELILAAGASPGLAPACAGAESALWAAALFGETEIAARLLENGADPNAAAFEGATPLIVAAQRQHHGIAAQLLAAGADPDITDAGGRTARDWTTLRRGSPRPARTTKRAAGSGSVSSPWQPSSGSRHPDPRERRAHFEATVRTVAHSPADKIVGSSSSTPRSIRIWRCGKPASYADPTLARRAQDLHRYLAQPFALWEHQTSLPGESTPYDELLDRIEALLAANAYRN